jgi:hypothetical protein
VPMPPEDHRESAGIRDMYGRGLPTLAPTDEGVHRGRPPCYPLTQKQTGNK